MNGAGIVRRLMEWLLGGPLPTGPEAGTEAPPAPSVTPDRTRPKGLGDDLES